MTIHDVLKYYQHGYSRVTDNLCREIRFGRITKREAKILENYYQSDYPKNEISNFLNWIEIKTKAFNWYTKKFLLITKKTKKKIFIKKFNFV